MTNDIKNENKNKKNVNFMIIMIIYRINSRGKTNFIGKNTNQNVE